MKIRLRLFAAVGQMTGRKEIELELPEGSTVGLLRRRFVELYPRFTELSPSVMTSVNHEYAGDEHPLADEDEVAFIPPVSGGEGGSETPKSGWSHEGGSPSDSSSGGPAPAAGASLNGLKMFEIIETPISADRVIAKVNHNRAGAVLTFVGTVREYTRGRRTVHLEYEAYPEMAEAKMAQIAREIEEKWPGSRVAITHRVGKLDIGEISVVIAVATPHRAESFEAGRQAIERLKKIVPIWKKEVWEDGECWVGAQE